MELQTQLLLTILTVVSISATVLEASPRSERGALNGNDELETIGNTKGDCPSVINNIVVNGNNGTPGPRGPPGPPGPAGPVGLPGLSTSQQGSGGGGGNFGGLSYTRWGRTSCPSTPGTELLYHGIMAGSKYNEGGGANYLCLPSEEPEFLQFLPGQQPLRATLYGVEYELYDNFVPAYNSKQHHNAPCAVCYTHDRSITVMIPAKINCPTSWTREYYGYLMTTRKGHHYRDMFECIDVDFEALPNTSVDTDPATLYFTETTSNGIPCGPYGLYEDGKEIPCVVCTK